MRALLAGMVVCAACSAGFAASADAAKCSPDAVWLRSVSGQVQRFAVELADDPVERAKGLMGRAALPASAGMLFVYGEPAHPVFWMKDTFIPLDILFFDPSGRLQTVHSMAIPNDPSHLDGGEGVQFVLEINGGLADRMGLTPGAVLRHPDISVNFAAWPCE